MKKQFYILKFNELYSASEEQSKNNHFNHRICTISEAFMRSVLFGIIIYQITRTFRTEGESLIDGIFSFFSTLLSSLHQILNENPFLVKSFSQEFVIKKNRHSKYVYDTFYFLEKSQGYLLKEFMKIENIDDPEGFIKYFIKKLKSGMCHGYTYSAIKNIESNLPYILSNSPEYNLDVVRFQIIHYMSAIISNNIISKKDSHLCDSSYIHKSIFTMQKELMATMNILLINKLDGRSNLYRSDLNENFLYVFFSNHLSNRGFVTLHNIKEYGNDPYKDLDDELFSDSDEDVETSTNDTTTKKALYVKENTKIVNLEETPISGDLWLHRESAGHSMFFQFSRKKVTLFDSNFGVYEYPGEKTFFNQLTHHIKNYYPDTDKISVTSMITKKAGF